MFFILLALAIGMSCMGTAIARADEVPLSLPSTTKVTTVASVADLHSAHDYLPMTDETWVYKAPDAGTVGIAVTFDANTFTEPRYDYSRGYDFVYLYDASDNLIGTYFGNQLASKTIVISGDTVKVRLTSDDSGNYYGFAVTSVTPVNERSLTTNGSVAAVADQLYTGSAIEPDLTVTYGGTTTLVKDTDYTVAFSNQTNAGTATFVVTGIGNYTGEVSGSFKIIGRQMTGYSVSPKQDGEHTNPPFGSMRDMMNPTGFHDDITITFEDAVTITDPAALASSIAINAASVSGGDLSKVTYTANGNSLVISVPFTYMPGGVIGVSGTNTETNLLAGIKVGSYEQIAAPNITTVSPTGLEITMVSCSAGTGSTCASTTYEVSNESMCRCMNHVVFMSNGKSIIPSSATADYPYPGLTQSTAAHHHMWEWMSAGYSAKQVQSNAVSSLKAQGYTITYDENAGTFTITDNAPVYGEVITAAVYDDDFMQANNLTISNEVKNVTPEYSSRWTRLAGDTRYQTMSSIIEEGYVRADFSAAKTVIVATGDNYPDALAATAYAGLENAPIVLTKSGELSDVAKTEIATIAGVTTSLVGNGYLYKKGITVYVVGGPSAVSDGVCDSIKAISGVNGVERISGDNRLETALAIYKKGSGWSDTAIIATGNGYADALSVAPFAYASNSPIFLVDATGKLDDADVAAIKDGGFDNIIIVGGTSVVSDDIVGQLGTTSFSYKRLAGANRYQTSAKIASFAVSQGVLTYGNMGIATGSNYADALAGSALCGAKGGVLLLVDSNDGGMNNVNSVIKDAIASGDARFGYIFGGDNAVSQDIETSIDQMLNPVN